MSAPVSVATSADSYAIAPSRRAAMRLVGVSLCIVVLVMTGCVSKRESGETVMVCYAMWVPLLVFLACGAGIAAGYFLMPLSLRFGAGTMGLSGLGFLLASSTLTDYVRVTPEKFETLSTALFVGWPKEVKFSEVSSAFVNATEPFTEQPPKNQYVYLFCKMKNGETEEFEVGELMRKGGLEAFAEQARRHGIQIQERK